MIFWNLFEYLLLGKKKKDLYFLVSQSEKQS